MNYGILGNETVFFAGFWYFDKRQLFQIPFSPHVRDPESSKFLLLEYGIQRTGIRNPQWFGTGIHYGMESGIQNPESRIQNPESWRPGSGIRDLHGFSDMSD